MNKSFIPTTAILLLADGTVFYGKSVGKTGTTFGEICFNTGMTGYQEVFTDPSYFGQIIIMTNDHLGNYGTVPNEVEADKVMIKGVICKRFSGESFSRTPEATSLQSYLAENELVGISDIDTRALTLHIRKNGAMNAVISSEIDNLDELKKILEGAPDMQGLDLAQAVSTSTAYFAGEENAPYKVAVLDCGIKRSILSCMTDRGVYAKVFNAKTSAEELKAWNPDGFFISNGPGDPDAMPYAVETVKQLQSTGKPLFGICLGHQLLALANGATTYKMHQGHRGLNHPVKNLVTGKSEITSQNHGFAVSGEAASQNANIEITHINLNDNTVEGLKIKNAKAFSVQHHPEASPGPHDSRYLFDDFIALMKP
jgi:carbamoyl-phosphate synthase small subunit